MRWGSSDLLELAGWRPLHSGTGVPGAAPARVDHRESRSIHFSDPDGIEITTYELQR